MRFTPLLAAAGGAPAFFAEVAALVVASAVVAYICQRFGTVPIVGFLLTGVLIGPHALGLVTDGALIDAAAEVGVVLLLFTVGIEFSLEKLAAIKGLIFGGGGLQVGLTTLATAGVLAAFGVGWRVGIYTGFLVALSSTAIVLKLLADRGETSAPHGQVGLGLLLFQDLTIVAMVLLVPTLAGESSSPLALAQALGTAIALIVFVLVVARRIMPTVLEAVARTCSPEVFLLSVVAICFGTAYGAAFAGVSLSLGAFLAGLLVSESRFSEHAFGEILPLQIFFSAAFFVSVGMLLDIAYVAGNVGWVLLAIGGMFLLKVLTTGVSALALGQPIQTAAFSGLLLAQVGEFSFVLERVGREAGLYPAGIGEAGAQTFIAATVVLMMATPFLARTGAALGGWLERRSKERATGFADGASKEAGGAADRSDHVIIAGYGAGGRRLAAVLQEMGLPYFILTLSPDGAREAEADGHDVLRADYSRSRTLDMAGLEQARLVVVADDQPALTERVVRAVRTRRPELPILIRTRFMDGKEKLAEAGADHVIAEEETGIAHLVAGVLGRYDVEDHHIRRHADAGLLPDGNSGAAATDSTATDSPTS
jgi:CPA2 family monovalent cation:H+ antiporter-2